MSELRFIDFFAGIGGMRHGLELAGHKCLGFCEFDKYAAASYISMYLITDEQRDYLSTLPLKQRQKEILKDEYRNGEWYATDIRAVVSRNLPEGVNCYTFGAPCQDFSVAGHRAGLAGDRSSLVREVFRLVEEQEEQDRPEWLIYENVKGMLSSNRGLDYLSILSEMDRLGYDCEWQNLNSAWFVPQNRERIYTVGHLRRYGPTKIFPVETADGENSISIIGHRDGYRRNTQIFSPDGITEALSTCQGGGREHHVVQFCDLCYEGSLTTTDVARAVTARHCKGTAKHKAQNSGVLLKLDDDFNAKNNFNQRGTVNGNGDQSRTLISSSHSGNEPKVAIPVLTPDRAEKKQNGRRMKDDGDPSFTLTAEDRHGVAVNVVDGASTEHEPKYVQLENRVIAYAVWYEKYQCYITIRKLTPRECFRLQGFSDDLFDKASFVNSDSQLYKQAGNAVTVNVAEAVGEKIKEFKGE